MTRSRTACRSSRSCRRRSRQTTRRRSPGCPSAECACGACSRDDPQPKLLLTSRIDAPWIRRHVEGVAVVPGPAHLAVVLEDDASPCPSNVIARRKRAGHDAVGVDVVAAHRNRAAGDRRDALHQSNSRTSITSPATAAAATIAGLMSSVRPGRASLPALEVAVRRRRAHLIALELVGIHPQAHRAAGAAPLEAGRAKHLGQPFPLGRSRDADRPGHDERLHVLRHVAALDDARGFAEVGQARSSCTSR